MFAATAQAADSSGDFCRSSNGRTLAGFSGFSEALGGFGFLGGQLPDKISSSIDLLCTTDDVPGIALLASLR